MRALLLALLLALGLVAAASAVAAAPASAEELEDADNAYSPDQEALESESVELDAKNEPKARKRLSRQDRERRFLRFLRRLSKTFQRLKKQFGKSSPLSSSGRVWRRRRGGRQGGRRRYFRLIRRLRSLARLLDGLDRSVAGCSAVSKSQRASLSRWAKRMRHFLPRNSTAAAVPRSLQ